MINIRSALSFLLTVKEFWIAGSQLLTRISTFIIAIFAAQRFPLYFFGWFAGVILVQLFIQAIQHALITRPYQINLAGQLECGCDGRDHLSATLFLQTLFIVLIIILGNLLFYIQPNVLQPLLPMWWWILLFIISNLLQDYIRRILFTQGKALYAFLISFFTSVLQLLIIFYLYLHHQLNFSNCFIVVSLSSIPLIILGIYLLNPTSVNLKDIVTVGKQHIKHGKWLFLSILLQWGAANFFIVAAGLILGPATLGVLYLAQGIFGMVNRLLKALEEYTLPNATWIYKLSNNALPIYLRRLSIKSVGFIVPALLIIIVFAKPIFSTIGGVQFVPYTIVLQGMGLIYILMCLAYPIRIAMRVLLLNKAFFTAYILAVIFGLLSAKIFIYYWNLTGVLAGLIISQILIMIYWLSILKKKNFAFWE